MNCTVVALVGLLPLGTMETTAGTAEVIVQATGVGVAVMALPARSVMPGPATSARVYVVFV